MQLSCVDTTILIKKIDFFAPENMKKTAHRGS